MDPFEVPENLSDLDGAALDALASTGREQINAIAEKAKAGEATTEDAAAAKAIAEGLRKVDAERDARISMHDDITSLADEFSLPEQEEQEDDEKEPEPEAEVEVEEPEQVPEVEAEVKEPVTASVTNVRRRVAAKGKPKPPAKSEPSSNLSITVAADAGFAAGSSLKDMKEIAEAFSNRSRGFTMPGTGATYQVAQISRNGFAADGLVAEGTKDDMDVINRAGDESRLKGGSLVAAAGWCAPSETLYDLCDNGASTEGMVDLPEMQVNRGGVRYTNGPDFSVLYEGGFHLTEAQAIAGQEKTCIDIPCPEFEEVRLDAVGICLTSPILMEKGYPELVAAFLGEAMVAHQWKVNGIMLNKMLAAAGTPINAGGMGSVAAGALGALELIVQSERTKNRWGLSETIEANVPSWVFGAMRLDYSLRNGVNMESVSDADITRWFADRNIAIKPLVGWQDLPEFTSATAEGEVAYPATFEALIYRSGTFVKGTQDVINLSAVHDSANLKKNQYTALFFEEAVLLLQRCYGAKRVTIPVCAGGVTGAANLSDCNVVAPVVP